MIKLLMIMIHLYKNFKSDFNINQEAPVAEWVKRWPTDLAVARSSPARGDMFSTVNGVPLHTDFHYHPPRPDD